MTTLALLLATALAAELPPPTDLDGDGKPERILLDGDTVRVGEARAECGSDSFPCEVEVHDLTAGDKQKEVAICSFGPRDDRSCALFAYREGSLNPLPFAFPEDTWPPSRIETKGNGIALAKNEGRLYTRVDKFTHSGGKLAYVAQAGWYVDRPVKVDRTFPITTKPGGGTRVAGVRPGSTITVLLESAEVKQWYLVHISSGLTGWVSEEALVGSSDELMALWGAG
jgi:hypothetical protein